MKIYYQKYNKGEMYCCSLKVVKEKFKNMEIKINYGSFGRKYSPLKKEIDYSYYKKNIKGIIISRIYIEYKNCNSMISFYIINENDYSLTLQSEFEKNILNQMLDFYKKYSLLNNKYSSLLVELLNNQLIIHKYIVA